MHPDPFSRFVNPVGVITAVAGAKKGILSAEWTSLISLEPKLLGIYIARERHSHDIIAEAGTFTASLLTDTQAEVGHWAGHLSGRDTEKWETLARFLEASPRGAAPHVQGANAYFECRVIDRHTVGSHTLYVGSVGFAESPKEDRPMLYHHGTFYALGRAIKRPE